MFIHIDIVFVDVNVFFVFFFYLIRGLYFWLILNATLFRFCVCVCVCVCSKYACYIILLHFQVT